jgi:glycosyltransferase involved in cell wall biosynthesis
MTCDKTIRILVLSHMYPNKSNPTQGIFIHNQIKHMLKVGCEVKVISPVPVSPKLLWFKEKWKNYGNIPFYDVVDTVNVYYPRYINIPGKWSHIISTYGTCCMINSNIDAIIREYKPQLLHAHTATPDGYYGLKLKHKYNLPLVCSLRGSDIHTYPFQNKLTKILTRKVILKADQVVSVSDALKNAAERIAQPKREIRVVYNGCEITELARADDRNEDIRKQLGIKVKDIAMIFVGDIDRVKGIYELINAFMLLKGKYSNLHLILLGNGPDLQTVRNMTLLNSSTRAIHFMDTRPHDEVFQCLKAADLFVLPTYNEGLPNALLEAMACGLPIIATKVGGIPEVVRNGINGILIEPMNSGALYHAMDFVLSNNDIAEMMARKGKMLVEREFTWQNTAERIITIYDNLLVPRLGEKDCLHNAQ